MVASDKSAPRPRSSRQFVGIGIRLAGVGTVVMAIYFLVVTESPIQGLSESLSWMIPVGLVFWIAAVGSFAAGVAVHGGEFGDADRAVPGGETGGNAQPIPFGSSEGWIAAARVGIEKRFPSVFHLEWTTPLLRSLDGPTFVKLGAAYFREIGFRTRVVHEASPGIDIWLYDEEGPEPAGAVECLPWGDALVGVRPVTKFHELLVAEGIGHGVMITTGSFSEGAVAFACGKTLELISGEELLAKLGALPEETSQRLLLEASRGQLLEKSAR